MPNYKKMYFLLFNKITDVIDQLEEIQQETESMFIEELDTTIIKHYNSDEDN